MTIVTTLSIYLIGIIVCTIGTGIWARLTSQSIDETDICIFCGFIFFWPFWLCLAVACVAFFFFFVKSIGFLMLKSGDWCDGIVNWWKSKKKPSNDNKVV